MNFTKYAISTLLFIFSMNAYSKEIATLQKQVAKFVQTNKNVKKIISAIESDTTGGKYQCSGAFFAGTFKLAEARLNQKGLEQCAANPTCDEMAYIGSDGNTQQLDRDDIPFFLDIIKSAESYPEVESVVVASTPCYHENGVRSRSIESLIGITNDNLVLMSAKEMQ